VEDARVEGAEAVHMAEAEKESQRAVQFARLKRVERGHAPLAEEGHRRWQRRCG
jgi:hypothetical protein